MLNIADVRRLIIDLTIQLERLPQNFFSRNIVCGFKQALYKLNNDLKSYHICQSLLTGNLNNWY